MELDEAELYAVAALGLMKDTVSPSFLECTCEGVLHVKGKSREEAAVQWMEEHFDSLQSACYAAGVLIEKAADKAVTGRTPDTQPPPYRPGCGL